MSDVIRPQLFKELDVTDPFFDTLRGSYLEFTDWFNRKGDEVALVTYDTTGSIVGFLYLKIETGPITDINPPLNSGLSLKIGTFKINPHNTKLGERYMKKVFDKALTSGIKNIYVTVFPEHTALIALFEKFGFRNYGTKTSPNGTESVYHKSLDIVTGDPVIDYPLMDLRHANTWLLSIYPEWHTRLFPDSILITEDPNSIIKDVSHTNSILKVYISWAPDVTHLKKGDALVMYRTAEQGKRAEYSAVATSLCMVLDAKPVSAFSSASEFVHELLPYSVFTQKELLGFYNQGNKNMVAIKMLYNVALPKRPIRKELIEEGIIEREVRPTFLSISKQQLQTLINIGGVYEGIVIY